MNGTQRNMSRISIYMNISAVILLGMASGCGGGSEAPASLSLNPVKGKVLLEDGKPLTSGNVVFVSSTTGISPNGRIGADGSFTLSSGVQGEGAPAGEYKVRIEPDLGPGTSALKPKAGAKPPFPSSFADEDSSGLKVTVKSGDNTIEPFKLSAKNAQVLSAPAALSRVRD